MANIVKHKSINATASVTPVEVVPFTAGDGECKKINFVINDDTTNNLWISLDNSTTEANYIVVKPGEALVDIELPFHAVWYRSSASTVAFRMLVSK